MMPSDPRRTCTTEGTREDTREVRATSRLADPNGSVADLIEDVCRAKGGAKAVTDYVDLSYSQIRKMAGDGSIPSLAQVVRFVELAGPTHPFRQALIAHLAGIFDPTPEQIAADITARVEAGTPVREAVREGLEFVELRPGQWVRHR